MLEVGLIIMAIGIAGGLLSILERQKQIMQNQCELAEMIQKLLPQEKSDWTVTAYYARMPEAPPPPLMKHSKGGRRYE